MNSKFESLLKEYYLILEQEPIPGGETAAAAPVAGPEAPAIPATDMPVKIAPEEGKAIMLVYLLYKNINPEEYPQLSNNIIQNKDVMNFFEIIEHELRKNKDFSRELDTGLEELNKMPREESNKIEVDPGMMVKYANLARQIYAIPIDQRNLNIKLNFNNPKTTISEIEAEIPPDNATNNKNLN